MTAWLAGRNSKRAASERRQCGVSQQWPKRHGLSMRGGAQVTANAHNHAYVDMNAKMGMGKIKIYGGDDEWR